MPRANIAAIAEWRAEFAAEQVAQRSVTERWVQRWTLFVCIATVLYILIGHDPYQRGVVLDEETGGAALSPVNRYIWLSLTGLSLPLLWARRDMLMEAIRQQWLILTLFAWFGATTLWAIDPQSANRRLFLYVLNLVIALALVLGFNSSRRLHRALAICSAAMVAIDLFSWLLMPGLSMTDLGLAGIHTQKNQLGAAMLFCGLVVGPYLLTQTRALPRLFWSCVFLAGFAMLVASQSKTSVSLLLGALGLAPILLFVLKLPGSITNAILATLVLLFFFTGLGWLLWCTAQGLNPLYPLQGITFTQRTDLWAFVFGEIVKRPFTGTGFGSFWDVNPLVQPSLQGELWFGSPDIANEAHNGYLDLMVTTGVFGLGGALWLLFRWIGRSLGLLRRVLMLGPTEDQDWPSATVMVLLPLLIFVHNFMESSYFTANQIFGSLILIIGVDIDTRWRGRTPVTEPDPDHRAQKYGHYHNF